MSPKNPQELFINNFDAFSVAVTSDSKDIHSTSFTIYPLAELRALLKEYSPNQELQIDYLMETNFQTWFSKSDLIAYNNPVLNGNNCIIAGRIEFDENLQIKSIDHDNKIFRTDFDNLKFILALLLIHEIPFADEVTLTKSDPDNSVEKHLVEKEDLNTWKAEYFPEDLVRELEKQPIIRRKISYPPLKDFHRHRLYTTPLIYPEIFSNPDLDRFEPK
jgi:hypothetical protein